MFQINEIIGDPKQHLTLNIPGYEQAELYLTFCVEQQSWFMTLIWEDFETNNERVVVSQNILRQYKNRIPFGIAIATNNREDPMTQDAFVTGVASLFLMTSAEAESVEETVYAT